MAETTTIADGKTYDLFGLKAPRNLAVYARNKGISDFGNLAQYDLYEKGFSILVVLKRPAYIVQLAKLQGKDPSKVNPLIPSWIYKNALQIGKLLDSFCDILLFAKVEIWHISFIIPSKIHDNHS